jgi:cytochrome c oxidase cbb3-type subunit III
VKAALFIAASVFAGALITACEREQRDFRFPADKTQRVPMVPVTDFRPGGSPPPPPALTSPFSDNAYAMSEGKRLYSWYNCVGCHAHGGGGIGPALMDSNWIYGGRPEQIYASIVQGRPNGMPSFGDRIDEADRWRLVAYVQSLSANVSSDAAPGRDDAMSTAPPESRRTRATVQETGSEP